VRQARVRNHLGIDIDGHRDEYTVR
jgi:hypothetical protein